MKTKTSQYLKYCLICKNKNKKINKIKYLKLSSYPIFYKRFIYNYYEHMNFYFCKSCNICYCILIFKNSAPYISWDGKKIFWMLGKNNYTYFRYSFSINNFYAGFNVDDNKLKNLSFKEKIKYISKYFQNQIFQ